MRENTPGTHLVNVLRNSAPDAVAWINGSQAAPSLSGVVKFYATPYEGILTEAEIFGLPNLTSQNSSDFYALHIHENGDCTPPFDRTGGHYNPDNLPHPYHAGDFLPLLGNQGYAWMVFYDKRLRIPEILGKSVIVHSMPDDFTTQPAGNSGTKIGCGVIR